MASSNSPMSIPAPKTAFWRDPEKRALIFQILAFAVVAWLLWSVINNTATNMKARGLASGFDFLGVNAGFGIIQTLIPYSEASSYGRTFIVGLLNTILVAVLGVILATIVGFIVGVARLSHNWLLQKVATVYVETFRNIPLLLQIFFWYHAVLKPLPGPRELHTAGDQVYFSINNRGIIMAEPVTGPAFQYVWYSLFIGLVLTWVVKKWADRRQLATGQQFPVLWAGLGLIIGLPLLVYLLSGSPISMVPAEMNRFSLRGGVTIIPELIALLIALVVYTAAFIAEIVRAGIQAVSHGQREAAYALGLRPGSTLRLVVIPQALRVIIPPLTSQYLNLMKNSSLATAIAYPDLVSVFAGTVLNQTGQAVEVMAMTLAVYLTLSLLISVFMNWYNSRMKLVER
ncbi:MAG: amino acid ABC transporter permease [Gammaproteobacteria bacterium]|nr:amino acid ABC transporter permease [Gammaproteobacteria bacterium]